MNAQPNPWPHMGQLFVDQGRLTAAELDDALVEQQNTGERLGEILVARGHITRIDLAGALSTQWSWQKQQPVLGAVADDQSATVDEYEQQLPHDAPAADPDELLAPAADVIALPMHELPAADGEQAQEAPVEQPADVSTGFVIEPAPFTPPPGAPESPQVDVRELESRVEVLEEAGTPVAELLVRVRSTEEQLAAAEARLAAFEPVVSELEQACSALQARIQEQADELDALRSASAKHEAQITAAAQALLD